MIFGAPMTSTIPSMETEQELARAFQESEKQPVLFYKHSNTCGTSMFSRREVQAVVETYSGPVYEIVVQSARHVSNQISSDLGVRHHSPQVLIVRNRRAVYHRSHGSINRDKIVRALHEFE
jgi:monothiol bacilliredoxin